MKRILAALSVVLFANQASAFELSLFEKLDRDRQDLYLGGIASALVFSTVANEASGYPKLICFPKGVNVGPDLARAAIGNQTDKNNYVALAVLSGLRKMFPCK